MREVLIALIAMFCCQPASASSLPVTIQNQLPAGFDVVNSESGTIKFGPSFYVVALERHDEQAVYTKTGQAPPRPLLLFQNKSDGSFTLVGRNDSIILRVDEGGQCDPFNDGYDGIVVTGRYFTVQNGVACGDHWTDFVTFRFDPKKHEFLFYKEIYQHWKLNISDDSSADAVVLDNTNVQQADPEKPLTLNLWKPSR
jgi:hypothetical protein